MNRFRWPLLLAILYALLVVAVITQNVSIEWHGILMLLAGTGIVGWAVWLWVDDETIADQQYVESVMTRPGDCLVCSGRARVSDLDRFNVLGLCRLHLREWAELHGVWRED